MEADVSAEACVYYKNNKQSLYKRLFPRSNRIRILEGKKFLWYLEVNLLCVLFVSCHRFGNVSRATDIFFCFYVMQCNSVRIVSLNVNGLNNPIKRGKWRKKKL